MPGFLLHEGAVVQCAHPPGQAQPQAPKPLPRVRVGGEPLGGAVVTQADSYQVTGCPFIAGVLPSPCLTASWLTAATRVTVQGVPVLLATSAAVCIPNGTPLTILLTQQRVRGA